MGKEFLPFFYDQDDLNEADGNLFEDMLEENRIYEEMMASGNGLEWTMGPLTSLAELSAETVRMDP